MKSVPDNEILDVLRGRYAFNRETMKLVNQRDPRYNELFKEFVDLVQRGVNTGMDVEDALYRWIDRPLIKLGLDIDNDEDVDLLANFKGDVNLNIKPYRDSDDDEPQIHEDLDELHRRLKHILN